MTEGLPTEGPLTLSLSKGERAVRASLPYETPLLVSPRTRPW